MVMFHSYVNVYQRVLSIVALQDIPMIAPFLVKPAAPDSDLQSSLTEPLNAERTMALS